MKKINIVNKVILYSIVLLGTSAFSKHEMVSAAQAPEITVIVNKGNPIPELSQGAVKLYFLRKIKKKWPNTGKTIKPVINASASLQNKFNTEILGMSEDEVTRYFVEKQYQNAETPPVKFSTDSEIIKYVAENEGAIGYIKSSSSTANVKSVMVLN